MVLWSTKKVLQFVDRTALQHLFCLSTGYKLNLCHPSVPRKSRQYEASSAEALSCCFELCHTHRSSSPTDLKVVWSNWRSCQNRHDDIYYEMVLSSMSLHNDQGHEHQGQHRPFFLCLCLCRGTCTVDVVVEDITRRRVSTHPHFYAIFCWLCGHVLPERKTAFEGNHSFIDRNVFAGIVRLLQWFLTMV